MAEMSAENMEISPMTAVCEARGLIRQIAGDAPIGTTIKSALARVAVLTGLGERRIRGLWHGEAKAVRAEELDKLRRVAARKATHEHPIGSELASAAAHFDRLADRLEAMDPEFYRDAIAGYRAMALGARHLDAGAGAR